MDCFCDYYPPPEFWRKSTPNARKQYRCEECRGPILPGERYEYVIGKWEGCVDQFRTCGDCLDIRQWVKNNVPCLCWAHGNMLDDCKEAVDDAVDRAPDEAVGLKFGFLRRRIIADRNRKAKREAA